MQSRAASVVWRLLLPPVAPRRSTEQTPASQGSRVLRELVQLPLCITHGIGVWGLLMRKSVVVGLWLRKICGC